jgi:hypothetical protein
MTLLKANVHCELFESNEFYLHVIDDLIWSFWSLFIHK